VVFLKHSADVSPASIGESISSSLASESSSVLSFAMSGKGGPSEQLWESVFQKPSQSKKALKEASSQPPKTNLLESLRSLRLTQAQLIDNGYSTLKREATVADSPNSILELKEEDVLVGVDKYSGSMEKR